MWDTILTTEAYLIIALGFMFGMFERVFDLLEQLWDWLIPFRVIDAFEMGVVLRWGKYARTFSPGLRWIWPLGVERVLTAVVVRTTSYLDVQSLTTKDGHQVNSSAIVIYKVGNIRRWLLEVDDAKEALHDMTYGLNDELTTKTNLEDIHKPEFVRELTELVATEAIKWGGRVLEIKFSDRAKSKSLRLWTGSIEVGHEQEAE